MNPAIPAATSKCPISAFNAPNAQEPTGALENTCFRLEISIGSPSLVPVPWVSIKSTEPGSTSPNAKAKLITSLWPWALGAVYPTFSRPSLFTAAPRTTAMILSPSSTASCNRLSTTTPTPSPNTVPLASLEKGRQYPSGEKINPSV